VGSIFNSITIYVLHEISLITITLHC